ncbi:unnamed protein product [marine sediment metagenome]|uniref:Uncharacterized protein n=1 Tax=marine sediment metagenome TaxID=412755 RepID=X1A5L3_9ZZZZ
MDSYNKENETEKLTHILSVVQNLYYKKTEQLEDLKIEISDLQSVLNQINSLISNKSFSSADELYSNLQTLEKKSVDDYFNEEISEETFKGTNIKRKIFSNQNQNEENLLCILNLYDFKRVEIKFIDPEKSAIQETSERFINIFLKGALIKIKENNPNLSISYRFKNTDKIEYITISNLSSIDDYDLITTKIRELLAREM